MKDECDIVKDLSSQYIEDMVSPNTKVFIEKHLQNCCDCEKYYENMKISILEETKCETQKEDCELDYLKKVRNRMTILKAIISIFIIIILAVVGTIFFRYQKINGIINCSYNEIENMKELSNYKLTVRQKDIGYEEGLTSLDVTTCYYYKDGKYKIDSGNTVSYYEDNSYKKTCVYNDLKQIEYHTQDVIEMKKGRVFNIFTEIISYKTNLKGILKLALSIRSERYNGVDCYVLRMGNKNSYKDVWIDKEKCIVLKVVEEEYLSYFRETTYILEIDKTTNQDIDVSILNTNIYVDYTRIDLSYNVTEEAKEFYENMK